MKNIVISLKTASDRRTHIQSEFAKQSINFCFFDALTPDCAAPLAEKMELRVEEQFLTKGELACFMSHVSIWQKMVDENIPYMAIFEDDVYLGENASIFLNDAQWIKPNWNIIKTETFAKKVFLGAKVEPIGDGLREISQLKGKNLGTAGYILSLKGAQAYLNYIKSVQLIALDQLMFDDYIFMGEEIVYQMSPALCIQEMMLYPAKKTILSSDLIIERKQRMRKYKKKGWAKVKLEVLRLLIQLKYKVVGKKVPFN